MRRKVFSLMLLLLAFVGVAKAEVVTIGDGVSTTYVTPFNSLWGYSFVEQIYTADEIGTAGTINAISFNMQSTSSQTNQVDVFMKLVSRNVFSSTTDYEPVAASDMVFSGTVTFETGWTTITLNTPFQYDGTSNLLIGMHEYTSGYSTRYFYYTPAADKVITFHSDSANPDPYNLGSYTGNKYTSANRANIQLDIIGGGSSATLATEPAVLDMGFRPNNAWMRPWDAQVVANGTAAQIVALESTNEYFHVNAELPGTVNPTTPYDFSIDHGVAPVGPVNGELVAMTPSRGAYIFPITATAYDPIANDVVETANTAITFTDGLFTATVGDGMYDNYLLPGDAEDGKDVVFKMVVPEEKLFTANVNGENGKWAVYSDFNGEPGPGVDNYYTGPTIGEGGSAGGSFEVQIGEGTTTTGYFPFYTLYNYSIAENLFLASELTAAGSSPMSSPAPASPQAP